jgi:uncharacterized protein
VAPLIVIPANDVDASGLSIEVELPVAWLESQLADAEARAETPGRVTARLSRSGKADIVVRGALACELSMPCARCLAPTRQPVKAELTLLLRPRANAVHHIGGAHGRDASSKAGAAKTSSPRAASSKSATVDREPKKASRVKASSEYEFSSEEADSDEYDGEDVVLDGFVREAILLELPSFPLCSEACPGMASGPSASEASSRRAPGSAPGASPSIASKAAETSRPNPFEVLKRLFPDAGGHAEGEAEGGETARRPSPAEVRKASRARSRTKPMIRSSLASRAKK